MVRKEDCTCETKFNPIDLGDWKPIVVQYDPRCPFHKGPDKGYGYDSWGQPNSKHSEKIGTIGAGIVVGCFFAVLAIIVYILVR